VQCEPVSDGVQSTHGISSWDILGVSGNAPAQGAAATECAQMVNLPTAARADGLLLRADQDGVREACDLLQQHSIPS